MKTSKKSDSIVQHIICRILKSFSQIFHGSFDWYIFEPGAQNNKGEETFLWEEWLKKSDSK